MYLHPRPVVLASLLGLSVVTRLLPFLLLRLGVPIDPSGDSFYPWNFSPLLAVGLFGGAMLADRRLAVAVPLGTYLAGDLGVWLIVGRADWAFYAHQPVVYVSVALVVVCGFLLRTRRSVGRLAVAGLGSATVFFLVSNFGVWALGGGVRYPLTGAGLVECYLMALPYFRNTVLGMAVFLPLLFSRVGLVASPRRTAPVLGRG